MNRIQKDTDGYTTRSRNLVGMRFSHLVVEEKIGTDKHRNSLWRCRCDCGNEIEASTRQLKKRDRRDCGCMQGVRDDLTGQRFGKLIAIEPNGKSASGFTLWKCRCDCGNEIDVEARRLKSGSVASCGCGQRKYRRDLTGMQFGRLTVLGPTDRCNKSGNRIWKCRCECGNEVELGGNQLTSGNTRSCGCLRREMWAARCKNENGEMKREEQSKEE